MQLVPPAIRDPLIVTENEYKGLSLRRLGPGRHYFDRRLLEALYRMATASYDRFQKALWYRFDVTFPDGWNEHYSRAWLVAFGREFTGEYNVLFQHSPLYLWVEAEDGSRFQVLVILDVSRESACHSFIIRNLELAWSKVLGKAYVGGLIERFVPDFGSIHQNWRIIDKSGLDPDRQFGHAFHCVSPLALAAHEPDDEYDQRSVPRPRNRGSWGQNLFFDWSALYHTQHLSIMEEER